MTEFFLTQFSYDFVTSNTVHVKSRWLKKSYYPNVKFVIWWFFFVKTKPFEFDCNESIWEMLTQRKNSLFKEIGLCFWEQDPFWSSLLLRSISGSFWRNRDDSISRNFFKKTSKCENKYPQIRSCSYNEIYFIVWALKKILFFFVKLTHLYFSMKP